MNEHFLKSGDDIFLGYIETENIIVSNVPEQNLVDRIINQGDSNLISNIPPSDKFTFGIDDSVPDEQSIFRDGNRYYVKKGADTFEFDLLDRDSIFRYIKSAEELTNSIVTAPMPGSIVDVLVENGQKVKKGQKIMIIEAMKMETTLVAEIDGIVCDLLKQKGDRIDADLLLFRISKEN
ncbi:MAG: hypothetical protein Kapaf2KO_04060 [Candidatus Kapaibacteriales bacterium]